jgi:hypothetical protein
MAIKIKTIKDVKEFTIKRSKWARGGMNGPSALLNSLGNMCCLGHYSKACGFSNEEINELDEPRHIVQSKQVKLGDVWRANYLQEDIELLDWDSFLIKHDNYTSSLNIRITDNTDISWKLMEINDRAPYDFKNEIAREKEIIKKFKSIGIKVKFVD